MKYLCTDVGTISKRNRYSTNSKDLMKGNLFIVFVVL